MNNNGKSRKFIGVHFKCCNVYQRVYINTKGDAYNGHCPKCGKIVHIKISPNGTDSRFFELK